MNPSDEQLSAWLDGELDEATANAVQAAIETDPDIAERLARLQRVDAALSASSEISPTIRADLLELAQRYDARAESSATPAGATVVPLRPRRTPADHYGTIGLAIAATLVVAVALRLVLGESTRLPLAIGTPVAAESALHEALEHGTSGEAFALGPDFDARLVLTFVSSSGAPCRELDVREAATAQSLVACRDEAGWSIRAAGRIGATAPDSTTWALASDAGDVDLERFLDAEMKTDALDAIAERALIDRGWRSADD